jgi:release factor glutamine methyltransferase
MEENVLQHEPHLALFVDNDDALIFYEKIADFAKKHLNTDGTSRENREGGLFFECNEYNAKEVVEMLKEKGFKTVELRQDMSGKDRMIRATI